MRVHESSALSHSVCENAQKSIFESFPGRPSVRLDTSVAVDELVPRKNDIWPSSFLNPPRGCSTNTDEWSKAAIVFILDNGQVGVQVIQCAPDIGGNVSVVFWNDAIVPLGDDVGGECGDRCGNNGLEGIVQANDVRLDLLYIWLNRRIRECTLDERERIWFQKVIVGYENGATD